MNGNIVILICCACIGVVVLQEIPPKFRLQNNAIPKSYSIRIQPNMTNNSFHGEVTIYVELKHPLEKISLNIKDLVVESLVLDNYIDETGYEILSKDELINIYFKDQIYIHPGEHMVHVKYSGIMRSDSVGLFRSIIESQGKKFVSAATMFSAPYARMVFPCFDEPAYKSRFDIRLVEPNASFTALSNMEKIGSYEIQNGIAVDFQTTPPISPYIVCFVFTQYKYRASEYSSSDGRIIPLRFFLLDEYLDQTPFLLDAAKHALQFFEEYTNMTYPTSKLDFIEVPDFIFEGMENIGLVVLTHNSVSFNASNNISEVEHLINAAELIVHEIAHMWFGDIVTPLWYNDLWLAEGFAELMEIKGLHNQYPSWQLDGMEAVLRHESTFKSDNAPVVNFPENNNQVEETFSDITYSKGSAILKMIEQVMGNDNFKNGVRKYLKKFYLSSAATGDFINVMQSITPHLNIRGFLETWLHQDKFPVITVKRDHISKSFILNQTTLLSTNTTSIFGRKWTTPIDFISNCKDVQTIWFDRDVNKLQIPICKDEKWTKFNHKASGFYRVHYSDEEYGRLLDNFNELHPVDQADLIQESLLFVQEREIPCEIPLKFVGKLRKKENLLPSLAAFKVIEHMFNLVFQVNRNRTAFEKMREYFIEIFKDLYEKLSWRVNSKDEHVVRLLRTKLIDIICLPYIEYQKCLKDAEKVKTEDGKLHEDVAFLWKNLAQLQNTRNARKVPVVDNTIVVNSTSSPRKHDLYLEKCISWIKLNL